MELRFLGTGGGRFVTGMQKRKTGGIVLKTEETQIHIDPGPGALVESHDQLDEPGETDALIVSHAHLDHANDAEAIIEMMVEAYDQSGTVFANETVLKGYSDLEKKISNYHQNICGEVKKLGEGSEQEFQDLEIRSQQMFHSDPKTAGFTVSTGEKTIGFWTDTEFSEELVEFYEGCDTLVVYCSRPKNAATQSHTALSDVPKITEKISPKTVIVTHFGFKFLDSNLEKQERWLDEEIDAKVVFAEEGMKFPGNRTLDAF
ncbi:MAG: MBL fold metallo-hydrolase [Candidatus Nanosalina sp.]